jgi:PAS domain S-box-containing protein
MPKPNVYRKWSLLTLYSLGLIVVVLFNATVSPKNILMSEWGYRVVLDASTIFIFGWIVICFLYMANVLLFTYFKRKITINEKKQLTSLFIGFFSVLALTLGANVLSPFVHLTIFPLTSLALASFSIIVAFAMMNYRMMRISLVEAKDVVMETMADSLVVVDENETIVHVNKSAAIILGYREKEVIGLPLHQIIKTQEMKDRVLNLPMFSPLNEKGKVKDVEINFLTKQGSIVTMDVSASLILNETKRCEGTVIVARDLTETKKLISELAVAKNFLETKVEERTRELYKANLELQNEVATRKGAEGHLRRSLQEKEFLLKEIHHRVKNNLQVISSILDLQAGSIADPHTLTVFKESQNRIRSMSLVHEQLYQSDDFAKIDFERYLQRLTSNLFYTLGYTNQDIRLQIQAPNISLSIDDSISCGFIITELITNSFKHGFPDGGTGTITIHFEKTDEGIFQLAVRDDGIGFPKNMDFRNTKTLGLQLVNILTNQLKGTITLDRGCGTSFTIRFPERVKSSRENHGENQGIGR